MNYRSFALVTALMLCFLPLLRKAAQGDEKLPAVTRPYAYLLPANSTLVVERLQQQGIDVEELREDLDLDLEIYQITKVESATALPRTLGLHNRVNLEVTVRQQTKRINAGTFVVRHSQKLGDLAVSLLEPQSRAGLVHWNYFDSLQEGQDFSVVRLPAKTPLMLAKARSLSEVRGPKQELTLEMLDNGQVPNFNGEPVTIRWLEDGDHFLQIKDQQLWKVHAVSGRSEPYVPTSSTAPSPAQVMQELAAASLEWGRQDPLHGPFVRELSSLPLRAQDGKDKGKGGGRELASTDPTKTYNAFVRNHNLYVEDIATGTERVLTKDGSDVIRNGKCDWVYWEEVYNRPQTGYKHYWWSNDGAHIAFVRLDDAPVPKVTVVNYSKPKQLLEITHYPRAGEPNPLVKIGIGQCKDGEVRWIDLSDYAKDESFLVTRAGFLPDNKNVFFCIQDRNQTWLDFRIVSVEGGKSTKIMRDSTKAWVEVPMRNFLKDGSVLLSSERTGWRHLYHYSKDGKLLNQLTKGDWDVRQVQKVDEDEGTVYFSGTKEGPGTQNAYKVKLDGTGLERVTKGKGENQVLYSPKGHMFVNTSCEVDAPPQVSLHRADGTLIRILDTNPVYVQDKLKMGEYKRFQIATPDGFMLEASYTKPANFDPAKKYPVWFTTYGGPRAPTLGAGAGQKGGDSALANQGYVVFRCDPRSASNKGAISAWACYKQLGVSELKDIETAIKWLTAHPWVDADRVGMTGLSYGGFMTAYCLCNSKLFAAGVASAPVTDWRNYDSIYTERYMLTPAENPQGYDVTSAVKTAKNVHGRLLLVHGLKDDNVHVQNTFQMAHALQQANKEFDIMTYPLARHGGFGASYNNLQRDFMKRYLKPEPQ